MVAAEHDAIVADETNQIAESLRSLDERVVVEASEITARKPGAVRAGLGPGSVSTVEAADVVWQEATAGDQNHRERGKPVERSAEDEAGGGQRRLEGITDQGGQIVPAEPLDRPEQIGMQPHRRPQVRRPPPERNEPGA